MKRFFEEGKRLSINIRERIIKVKTTLVKEREKQMLQAGNNVESLSRRRTAECANRHES